MERSDAGETRKLRLIVRDLAGRPAAGLSLKVPGAPGGTIRTDRLGFATFSTPAPQSALVEILSPEAAEAARLSVIASDLESGIVELLVGAEEAPDDALIPDRVPDDEGPAFILDRDAILEQARDAVDRSIQADLLEEADIRAAASDQVTVGSGDECKRIYDGEVTSHHAVFVDATRGRELPQAKIGVEGDADLPTVHIGRLDYYETSWRAVGHVVGGLIYSLPLAPCETVRIAVIDWTARDIGSREGEIGLSERASDNLAHTRLIDETIAATVREEREARAVATSGNLQAGVPPEGGAAAIAAAGGPPIPVSLGGALGRQRVSETSTGSRRTNATSVQNLADRIERSGAAVRRQRSTVITQTVREQGERIETRAVTNNNHCHALTILYHEVLRRYRVITRWTGRRGGLWIAQPMDDFDEAEISRWRHVLEPGLLLPDLAAGFDDIQSERFGENPALTIAQGALDHARTTRTNLETELFNTIEVVVEVGDDRFDGSDERLILELQTTTNTETIVLANEGFGDGGDLRRGTRLAENFELSAFRQLPQFLRFRLRSEERTVRPFDDLVITEFSIAFLVGLNRRIQVFSAENTLIANRPEEIISGPLQIAPLDDARKAVEDAEARVAELEALAAAKGPGERLMEHLNAEKIYYRRLIWRAEDPDARLKRLDALTIDGRPVSDLVLNEIADVQGCFVVMPLRQSISAEMPVSTVVNVTEKGSIEYREEEVEAPAPEVRVVSLPTPGVLAETQLSECSACEVIDHTRYWNWEKDHCGCGAPEITGVSPNANRGAGPDLTPDQLAASGLTLQTAPAVPTSNALDKALDLLKTASIFGDGPTASTAEGQKLAADVFKALATADNPGAEASSLKAISDVIGGLDLSDEEKRKLLSAAARQAVGLDSENEEDDEDEDEGSKKN
ncbi:MAG: hypothetical protein AAFN79_22135 [Pseudomonadota bacterium]